MPRCSPAPNPVQGRGHPFLVLTARLLGFRRLTPGRCKWCTRGWPPFPRTCPLIQMSSLLEYPFTRAPSTASESTKRRTFFPLNCSLKLSRASTGAKSSTMEIWFFLTIQVSMCLCSSFVEKYLGASLPLASKSTPPTCGCPFSAFLQSGKKPSVKMTFGVWVHVWPQGSPGCRVQQLDPGFQG